VGDFVKFFRNVAEQQQTDTMVGVFISSELSGTFASATQARSELPDLQIELVDSRSASMGTGFQALVAARAARLGASPAEVLAQVEHVRETVQVLFVVDTLEFLHRGGRIGGAARFLGTALNLKPLLTMEKGRVEALEKVRSRRKSLQRLVELAAERLGGRPMGEVAVLDVDAREEADEVISQVVEQLNPRRVYRTAITPVIGAHTGPGAVGLIFYQD
jgi:DegV family protein with EDD domain